jgi:hypothetical protein
MPDGMQFFIKIYLGNPSTIKLPKEKGSLFNKYIANILVFLGMFALQCLDGDGRKR